MKRLFIVAALLGMILLPATGGPFAGVARAQAPATPNAASPAPAMPDMMSMMKMHQQMMAGMKADEAKLDALVKDMNEAKGEARVNALTAVVNEIVRQHKAERAHMAEMMAGHHAAPAAEPGHVH